MLLCIGEAMREFTFLHGNPSFEGLEQASFAGDVLNTAIAVKRLHPTHEVGFLTCLGADPDGLALAQFLHAEGIAVFSPPPAGWTGSYTKQIDSLTGERSFQYQRAGSAANKLSPVDLDGVLWDKLTGVYSSGITMAISDSAQATVFAAFKKAQRAGITVWFDPNIRPALWQARGMGLSEVSGLLNELLPNITRFLPSLEDCKLLAGLNYCWPDDNISLSCWLNTLSPTLTVKTVLTLGDQGAAYWPEDSSPCALTLLCPQSLGPVIDTCGAGDLFNAALWLASQKYPETEAQIKEALKQASSHVQQAGTLFQLSLFS